VDERDLAYFEANALANAPLEGASPWELMFDKDVPGFVRYTAWRRTLPCGKTEYKSVTVAPGVTPHEFMDMYLDDAFRRNWVSVVPRLRAWACVRACVCGQGERVCMACTWTTRSAATGCAAVGIRFFQRCVSGVGACVCSRGPRWMWVCEAPC
jgi:hypothetical protein